MNPGKGIPASIENERAVLGCILIDPDTLLKVSNKLQPSDFFREKNGWIYEAMLKLSEQREPIDTMLIINELEAKERLAAVGGPAALTDLLVEVPTAFFIEHYAQVVIEASQRRKLIAAAGKIAALAYDEDSTIAAVLDQSQQMLFAASEGRNNDGLQQIKPVVQRVIDSIDQRSRNEQLLGIPTGFAMLDRMLGGLQKSDLIILAARPGMGKSALAFQVGYNAAVKGQRVGIFSLEMSDDQFVQRQLSTMTGIDSHRLRMGSGLDEAWPDLLEAANTLGDLPIYMDDTPALTVNEIRTKARKLSMEDGLDLLIVDYMQLMSGGKNGKREQENRQQEISYISRSMKALARELHIPIIALSQLSRAVESRADKRPMLSDLRESGSLEQDADAVLFIYREDYYIEDTDRQNIADIIIAKHRHGATGTVSLYFRKELTQFRDLEIQRTELN